MRHNIIERFLVSLGTFFVAISLVSSVTFADELADEIRQTAGNVVDIDGNTPEARQRMRRVLDDDVDARFHLANRQLLADWRAINSRESWEEYRDERLERMRAALGQFPPVPDEMAIRVTGTVAGPGYLIDNVLYESRPDLWVTGNLYRPADPRPNMPALLICPSHHNPKTQSELQDMGMMWAREGCLVLVVDNLGHGERRQHPFRTMEDYAGDFRLGRQDYFFRYNVGMQLHLVGESLLGWIAWDLMRGVDVLLRQPGADPNKVVLLGSVAGGGDPAAVAAALDPRIACAVPFNFGGPQPETRFPLPDDPAEAFNYLGGGSWESTRNSARSACDGFPPWVIVGSVAPRRLIYAHEFRWDQPHDPVWRQLQTIFGYYDADGNLDFTHGYGSVSQSSDVASHCNNIGKVHRERIHQALAKWFELPLPKDEPRERHESHELHCLEGSGEPAVALTPVHVLATRLADDRIAEFRGGLRQLPESERRGFLQQRWTNVLGETSAWPRPHVEITKTERLAQYHLERIVFTVERDFPLPALLFRPLTGPARLGPTVIGVAQGGKGAFLEHRAAAIARLLQANVTVCLVDVRGTGETSLGDDRGRRSAATGVSSSQLMLGTPHLGEQLRDLRTVIRHLRQREDLGNGWFALWGDSFAPSLPVDAAEPQWAVPHDANVLPPSSEPAGPLLALLAALYEPDVRVVAVPRGGLASFQSVLASPFCYLPHDCIVPGLFSTGDIPELIAAASSGAILFQGAVDGLNRPLSAEGIQAAFQDRIMEAGPGYARKRQGTAVLPDGPPKVLLQVEDEPSAGAGQEKFAQWLIEQLSGAVR
ncbi:MAG: hypothetical protein AB7O62_22010 [Pirellulales bacterium]